MENASRPTNVPGVLRHSVKLRTSTPGYIAEKVYRDELLAHLPGMMTSPTQCTIYLWQSVIFRSEVGNVVTTARIVNDKQ
jgi:hypothetical protein